jgi:hypothetical protein
MRTKFFPFHKRLNFLRNKKLRSEKLDNKNCIKEDLRQNVFFIIFRSSSSLIQLVEIYCIFCVQQFLKINSSQKKTEENRIGKIQFSSFAIYKGNFNARNSIFRKNFSGLR